MYKLNMFRMMSPFILNMYGQKEARKYIKLNFRAIVTNIALCDFSQVESENCTFCNQHRETLVHLFCIVHANYLTGFTKLAFQQARNQFQFYENRFVVWCYLSSNNEILNCILLCYRLQFEVRLNLLWQSAQ